MVPATVALIGDYDPAVVAHRAIPQALALAADAVRVALTPRWIPTEHLAIALSPELTDCDAVWCVPASPYRSLEGALRAIRFAREQDRPFLGTCGGFQHAVLEYFRNVLGVPDAEHLESAPGAAVPVIAPLACPLIEHSGVIRFAAGSRLRTLYGVPEVEEAYHCSYGLNPRFEGKLREGRLRISGRDAGGEVRAVELDGHPFYVATLFQPERSALRQRLHPLIRGFVAAVACREHDSHDP